MPVGTAAGSVGHSKDSDAMARKKSGHTSKSPFVVPDPSPEEPIVQQFVAQIPRGHNVRLLDQEEDSERRAWFIPKAIEPSRSELEVEPKKSRSGGP